jgi:hypothetical protein
LGLWLKGRIAAVALLDYAGPPSSPMIQSEAEVCQPAAGIDDHRSGDRGPDLDSASTTWNASFNPAGKPPLIVRKIAQTYPRADPSRMAETT